MTAGDCVLSHAGVISWRLPVTDPLHGAAGLGPLSSLASPHPCSEGNPSLSKQRSQPKGTHTFSGRAEVQTQPFPVSLQNSSGHQYCVLAICWGETRARPSGPPGDRAPVKNRLTYLVFQTGSQKSGRS